MLSVLGQQWASCSLLASAESGANWVFAIMLFVVIPIAVLLNAINWFQRHFGPAKQVSSADQAAAAIKTTADEIKERSGMRQEQRAARRWHG